MRERRLEVQQAPGRLSLDEGRDDVERGFQSCDSESAALIALIFGTSATFTEYLSSTELQPGAAVITVI